MKAGNENLWVEKFRPDSIKNIILPRKYKIFFNKMIESKELQNLILCSNSPGTSKTTTAMALCKDIGADVLYKNMSKDRGIDVLRNEISRFANTKSFSGSRKVVILDEVCQATIDFQKGLKAFIEQYSKTCRFILTCNTISKVIPELHSRCKIFDYNWNLAEFKDEMRPKIIKRIESILKSYKVEYDISAIEIIVDKYFPDIRMMYNVCQQYSEMNGKIDKEILNFRQADDELVNLVLNKKFSAAMQYVIDKNIESSVLFRFFYDNVIYQLDKTKIGRAIICINEYQKSDAVVVDKQINIAAFLVEFIGEFIQ